MERVTPSDYFLFFNGAALMRQMTTNADTGL